MRDFNQWFSTLKETNISYDHFVDFMKVYENASKCKVELNLMNSLIGSSNIEEDFESLLKNYPRVLTCVPLLLAVRSKEIKILDHEDIIAYHFAYQNQSVEQYKLFMRETGLFDLIQNHVISNLVDYVTGIEVGMDTNARKNRSGKKMESLVESYLIKLKIKYKKQMRTSEITKKWGIDLSAITSNNVNIKKFDFVVKTPSCLYCIETNFYNTNGSKVNETARSYEMLATHSKNIENFKFIWITDGLGWKDARNNLAATFAVLEDIYNLKDLENGIFEKIFK